MARDARLHAHTTARGEGKRQWGGNSIPYLSETMTAVSRQETFARINRILAQWDPISVGEFMAVDEYNRYVPEIAQALSERKDVYGILRDILTKRMQLPFDENNATHVADLRTVADQLTVIPL